MVPILVLLTFIVAITVGILISRSRVKVKSTETVIPEFNKYIPLYPSDYLLFNNHIWLKETIDNYYTLGLDELLSHFVGIPDHIYLRNKGDKVNKGEQIAVLKKDKKEIYIQAPISGTIKNVNDTLSIKPRLIDTNPYNDGWLYTIETDSIDTKDAHINVPAYNWLKDELIRLKEFIQNHKPQPIPNIETLMDGGWPIKGIIDNFDQQTITLFEQEFLKVKDHS